MRQIDRLTVEKFETPSLLLMEAAADATFRAIESKLSGNLADKKARVLCGPGNNGGDGAAVARALACLADLGAEVRLIRNDIVVFWLTKGWGGKWRN